jgi:hypothetical protein
MTFKALQNLITNTTAYTAVGAAQIALPASVIAMLTAQLAGGAYYTAVSVTDGVNYEVMNIVGVTAGGADVVRGVDGTVAVPLAQGSQVRFVWTTQGIGDVAPGGGVTLTGAGGTAVSGGPDYVIGSYDYAPGDNVTFTPLGPLKYAINFNGASPVGPPAVTVTASGIATASGGPVNYNIFVAPPAFVGAGGITVTGTWPDITITNELASGGTLMGVIGGAGITVSGDLTLNPTISLSTVGPGIGAYGGIHLNAYGQVTAIDASLVTGITSPTSGVTIGGPTAGVFSISVATATHTQQGLVSLAPTTGANDVANDTQAVTPAGIANVVAGLTNTFNPASFTIVGNQNALSPAAYTNTISSFIINIPILAAGKSALIDIYVESYDPVNPTVLQNLGIGLFDAAILLAGVSNLVSGNVRHLKYLAVGPTTVAGSLTVKTTPLVGSQIIGSYHASVTKNF